MTLLAFALACTPPPHIDPVETGAVETGETGEADDTGETGDTGPAPDPTCPDDMVPVFTGDLIHFCIDPYEIVATGDAGPNSQYDPDDLKGTAVTTSADGVTPTTGYTFDQAVTACANTPVLNADGEIVGSKRLATSAEWRDAGDGVFGDGGLNYPYGDVVDTSMCATLDQDGQPQVEDVVPTGSFPDCVSPFGAYDLIGNAWEWADPEVTLDIEAWLDARANDGEPASWSEGVPLVMSPSIHDWVVDVAGANKAAPASDEDGYLYLPREDLDEPDRTDFLYTGYVRPKEYQNASATSHLPIELIEEDDRWWVYVLADESGAPLTDKRGAAWYSGAFNTTLQEPYHGHFHDFNGTIGFRCTADPID